ncbi:uncharacterized protein LOC126744740 [Anthonomus grandis grandis]|uniref:uncharacterized protein LOC126744740 n=1 Tax=Anthonomus grandis grandis TaxID=2921223 RepID=UPI0021656DEE|nr:uncharacterized protein LOC126744740 [Anthonomus grandis grandis]
MSPSNQRLRPDAIPTLFLTRASTSTDNSNIIASHTLRKEFSDASVQTDTPMQVNVSVQTDVCNNTDKFCQTSMKISAITPRKIQLRKEIKTLEKEGSHAKRSLEVGVTLDDVQKFQDDNYPADSCAFLKSQLSLLNKSPLGSRYTNEYKQFAMSLYLVGPKPNKKMSFVCRQSPLFNVSQKQAIKITNKK